MKHLAFVAFALLAVLLGAGRARAITEFCPAHASPLNALDATTGSPAATTFSYELDAPTPSVVSGTLAIETDKGWYAAPFGLTAMSLHDESPGRTSSRTRSTSASTRGSW